VGLRTLQIGNDWLGERQGGLNRVYAELVKHLPSAGVEVRGLVAARERAAFESGGVVTGFASPRAPLLRRLFKARSSGLHFLRQEKSDLIAVHFALYAFPLLDQLGCFPTVIHFHGPWAAESGAEGAGIWGAKLKATLERLTYQHGRRFIVLSQAFAIELQRRYGISEELIRLVPGGIDIDRFHDHLTRYKAREQMGWPTDRPIVLSIRRQMRRMGLENLIDAARILREKVPDVLVLLGGSGPITGDLQQRIDAHGLQESVRLLGRIDDVDLPTAYRAADISVVPTQALEGFGMITLESLASGTPVLVTPVGGLPEVVGPLAPQCVLDGMSAELIAQGLIEVLRNERPVPSSDACRAYAVQNFSWPVIAQLTRNVYEEALK
jgi:glycosyltransferase involved in cell wall biosynthesis